MHAAFRRIAASIIFGDRSTAVRWPPSRRSQTSVAATPCPQPISRTRSSGWPAEAGGARWRIGRRRFWQRVIQATDGTGTAVGEFEPRGLRRGGTLRWAGRELTLRPASSWRERYALADGDRELAVFDGKGWGRRPVKVSVDDPEALEPGLLLFAAFVVRGLAADAGGAAGAGAGTTASSG
jgi:hypothetical protein